MEMEMRKEAEKYAIVKYKAESTELFTKDQTYKAYFVEYWQGKADMHFVACGF